MSTYFRILAALSVSLSLPPIPANAADETKGKKADQAKSEQAVGKLASDDISFLKAAAADGIAEVKLGELAQEKGSTAEIKEFGKMMVTDHGKANEELQVLATAKGVGLPTELDGEHKSALDHVNGLSGAEFDKTFMQHMVADHEKAVADFTNASQNAKDAELKAWAAKTLPTLQDHLTQAQAINAKLP